MKRGLALAIGLAAGLLVFTPARLLLPSPPLAAAAVDGSPWQTTLTAARLGQLALGDLVLALEPAALLQGRLAWQAQGALTGRIWRGFTAGGVTGVNGRLPGVPGLPVAGISLADATATLDGAGRCQAASGQVTADLALPLAGQRQLAGAPRCDGEALLLPLASADGRVRLEINTRAGGWTARLQVTGAGPAEAAALLAAGFRSEGGSLVKEDRGA